MSAVTLAYLKNIVFVFFGGVISGLVTRMIRQFLEKIG